MDVAERVIDIEGVPHFLARAAAPTTTGVLLLPHVTGIDGFVREVADTLAARGHTTLAWNPYPDLPMGASFPDNKRPARPTDAAAMQILSRCMDVMGAKLGLTNVATLGFCMGGRYALLFGNHEPRLRAVAAAYPSIPAQRSPGQDMEPVPAGAGIACPVLVIYPGQDRVTPRPVFRSLQAMLQGRSAETSILYYPDAEHGFMHAPSPVNDAATRTARPQMYAFLEAHLGR